MKRHPLDIVSLVFGLFFAAVGLTFLVSEDPWDLVFDSVSLTEWGFDKCFAGFQSYIGAP